MEQWEQEALGDFQQRFSKPLGSSPLPPGMPAQMPGGNVPRPELGQMARNVMLGGPAAQAGHGAVQGIAGIGDSVIGLAQRAMGDEPTNPLGTAVKQHLDPVMAGVQHQSDASGMDEVARGAAKFGGEVLPAAAAGGKAVNMVAGGLGKIAPASQRLQQFLGSMRNFGAGRSPIPACGSQAAQPRAVWRRQPATRTTCPAWPWAPLAGP
jgi:hypothetical protein